MATLYSQLRRLARPVVKHYLTDLTMHDRLLCDGIAPGNSALWMPRLSGTQWVWVSHREDRVDVATRDSLKIRLTLFDEAQRQFEAEGGRWYMLECLGRKRHGTTFKLSADEARKLLAYRLEVIESALARKSTEFSSGYVSHPVGPRYSLATKGERS